jgi:3-methyladenine DNA glycosylase AlkD
MKKISSAQLIKELERLANPAQAKKLQRYFKTGPGEYGEGDIFWGLKLPQIRVLARKFVTLNLSEIEKLLQSKVHEQRMVALLILVQQYQKLQKKPAIKQWGEAEVERQKKEIFDFYIKNWRAVNNWDLVDLSAPTIAGDYFWRSERGGLRQLARSKNIWQRRIASLATFNFIRQGDLDGALEIAEMLLVDNHDLIHKAVGWMLREVGKRDWATEEKFVRAHHRQMPRTMLRYAIERWPTGEREKYVGNRKLGIRRLGS